MGQSMVKPEPGTECIIELNEAWVSSLMRKVDDAHQYRREGECTIFRTPPNIREQDRDAYEPKIISLGPYHRCKPHLQAMNELKLQFVRRLLQRNPGVALEVYLRALKKLEKQARSTYSEDIDMESNDFVEMLLLDGCFVVELLLMKRDKENAAGKRTNVEDYHHPVLEAGWALHLIAYDMLLLENQLPFFALDSIFRLANEEESYVLTDLAFDFIEDLLRTSMRPPSKESVARFHHLLHFLHSCIAPAQHQQQKNHRIQFYNHLRCLDYFRSSLGAVRLEQPVPASIPCAKLLDEAGVKFRTTEGASFLDLTFVDGVLLIPTLNIDDVTNSVLRNLIAFEQCFPAAGTYVTAYSHLMDSIIDTPMDVVLLRQKGIIVNCLGSDSDAALLFNKLCKEVLFDNNTGYLSKVFKDVKRHCDSRWNRHRSYLMHNYFSSPWSIISVVAAVILLLFAAIQTTFAVLSYFKPPS